MSRLVFVIAAGFLSVGGVVVAYLAMRQEAVSRPPDRSQRAEVPAPAPSQPTVMPDVSAIPPASRAVDLPVPEPAPEPTVASTNDESIEDLFARAMRLADEEHDYKGAIVLLKQVVARQKESRPLAARALFEIGCCLEKMGRSKEAQEAFELTVATYPDQTEAADAAWRRLPPEGAERADFDKEVRRRLEEKRIDLDALNQPFPDVVGLLRERGNVNVVIDYEYVSDLETKCVTVRLWNVTVVEALDRVCSEAQARWSFRAGLVWISSAVDAKVEEAEEPPELPEEWEKDVPAWRQEEEAMRAALSATPLTVDLTDVDLRAMAEAVQTGTRRIVVIDPAIEDAAAKRITFRVDGLDPSNFLALVCRMLEIDWYADRGTIHLTTKEAAEAWRKEHE